jgi:cytochrome c oxidase subunit II
MSVRRRVPALALVALTACSSRSVVIHPAGPEAARASGAWLTLAIVAAVVGVAVVAGIVVSLFVGRGEGDRRPSWLGGGRLVVAGGFVLPAVVVVAAVVVGSVTTTANGSPTEGVVHIRIEAHQWWWNVEYLDSGITSANEIVIPTGTQVELEVTSDNVVHSLWFPQLGGRADVIPGRVTVMTIQADEPGVYDGRCAEYCGLQHAHMGIEAIAKSPESYDTWVSEENQAVEAHGQGVMPAGFGIFISSGCDRCHTIAGTVADGVIGPDLTHVGTRRTIGAGALPNTAADMARWISDPWSVKPGAKMPGFAQQLTPYQLGTLIQYLETLR